MEKEESAGVMFPELTFDEARQMCYIAYYGENYGSSIPSYLKKFRKTRKNYDETVQKLQQLGYLKTSSSAAPDHHLDILDFLATVHSDWLNTFKSFRRFTPTHACQYLWQLAELLRNDDLEGAAKLRKPYEGFGSSRFNVYTYIRNRAIVDPRYAMLLDNDQIATMTDGTLKELAALGTLNIETLDSLRQMAPKSHKQYDELIDKIDLYEFLLTGTMPAKQKPKSVWSLSGSAIRELYLGKVEDSLALFRKAVSAQKPKSGCLPLPILNFFYALCVIKYRMKYGERAISDVMNELRNSSPVRLTSDNFAARLLLEYAEMSTVDASNDVQRRAEMVLGYADNNLNRCFVVLLANFFETENKSSVECVRPALAIMQHEMSPFIAVSTTRKEELMKAFGGKPLLAVMRRKASWEVLLGEIDNSVEKTIDDRPRRIIYFMQARTLTTVVEQAQDHDGTWHDTQLLSVLKLCSTGYDSMDESDLRVAMELSKKLSHKPGTAHLSDADIVIPNLANTERVYYGKEYAPMRRRAKIIQEKPCIEFNGQGDQIMISSNVKIGPDGQPLKHTVTVRGDTFTLVTVNALQKDILGKLLSRKSLPASAAPSLRTTIESLSGIFEVRENILSDIVMKAFESEGRIAIRIEPEQNTAPSGYKLTFLSTALPEGIARLVPTVGEEYVYDEDEAGHTHCVHRNMLMEEENYQGLVDYAEQFELEFSSFNVCTIAEERVLLNFLVFCHNNRDKYVVEWPNGQILKFKGIITEKNIDIEVMSNTEWFSVEGKVNIGVDVFGLDELLKACCRESYDGFVRIGEHEYIKMTETLRRHVAELDAILNMGDRKQKSVPKYLVGALAERLEKMNQKVGSEYKEFREKMKEAYNADIKVPDGLQATLRPYQKEGFEWIWRLDAWGAGACLADDMGLGKTIQTITFMLSKADRGPSLVVAPKSVIPNWVNEVAKFAPSIRVNVLNETPDRQLLVDEAPPYSIVLCTYGVLTTESQLLQSRMWNVVCLDEAHQIKNRNTLASQAAMELKSMSRVILTGTPLQNHVGELWNLMQFINPGLLGKWSVFRDTYVNADIDEEHSAMLKELTQPFILRRTKMQVLGDLPEKTEGTHYVTMSEKEFRVYETMRQRVELKFKKGKSKDEKVTADLIDVGYFSELMKLRLASCDMHLVYNLWKEPSTKITSLMEILERLLEVPDNSILVFSQFTSFLARIKLELDKHGWEYYSLDGQTPMNKRREMVEDFQNGEKRLFLSSLKAGGLGINLTRANYVIMLDPWWNPAIENQAADRAHRLGQQRCVSVIRLISQHTIEEKILRMHEKKQSMSDDVLDGTADSSKLTYDDILEMVAPY